MPRGTVDRRFRGNNFGRGANLTLRVGNEEEEEEVVVVGGLDDNSKDEDVDKEICLFKGILRVKGDLVGCGSRDSISSAIGFRTVKDDNTPK